MKISIVVPVYNVEKYLIRCVNSIIMQTVQPFEIILVDDCSTDNSSYICDNLERQYKNVRTIHKEINEGLGLARNTGLKIVSNSADYIMFVDSDDYLDNDAIELLISSFKTNFKPDCIFGGYKEFCGNRFLYNYQLSNHTYVGKNGIDTALISLCGGSINEEKAIPYSVWNCLFKKSLIEKYHLRFFSERSFISEDLIFKYDFISKSETIIKSSSTAYNYRKNPNSLSRSYRKDRFEANCILYDYMKYKLKSDSIYGEAIDGLNKNFLINIRSCIKQECPIISGKSIFYSINNIRNICQSNYVKNAASLLLCPKLNFKQKTFIYLIKNEYYILLFLLSYTPILK